MKKSSSLETALAKQGWVVSDSKVATNTKTGETLVLVDSKVKRARRHHSTGKTVTRIPFLKSAIPNATLQKDNSNHELLDIADYALKELKRLSSQYQGDTLASMKALVAVHIGHMVLSMKDYDAIPPRNFDVIFNRFGTTFKQIERDIEKDMMWGEE